MKKSVQLYQQSTKGTIKTWKLELDVNKITTSWGYKGGAMQSTMDIIHATGKVGTKSYRSAEQQASLEFDRMVKGKEDKGYVRNEADLKSVLQVDSMTFDPPPTGFTPPKPIKEYPDKKLETMIQELELVLQKKYDGSAFLAIKLKDRWELYTRTLERETDNFPDVVKKFNKIKVPAYSILVGELYVGNGETMEEFDIINSMTPMTLPETAIEKQKTHQVHAVLFDTLFWDGQSVCEEVYKDRRKYIKLALENNGGEIHLPQEVALADLNDFKTEMGLLKKRNWEGYVLRDLNSTTAYSLNGKEQRPKGCWKVKEIQEDEFVATGYELGNGKHQNRVGKFRIVQYNRSGQEIDCGYVGGGISDELRTEALQWEYPCVVRVQFDRRQRAGNASKLRFPVFLLKHPDKKPKECICD